MKNKTYEERLDEFYQIKEDDEREEEKEEDEEDEGDLPYQRCHLYN